MNPGVNESANKFRGPRSQSMPQLTPWAQQQHQASLIGQPLSQPQSPFVQLLPQQQYQVPITGVVPDGSAEHQKRMRGGRRQSEGALPTQPLVANVVADSDCVQQQHGKRSRGNAYRAPREVKKTVNSVMGSLVGGPFQQATGTVRIRRQLSGSQLDQFMSQGDDKMDEDTPGTRERAMSF
eukprot:CAMPEP_0119016756 /NCGR_PEP_ID=MMETSP1176-20130426/14340_1 /TAXON_ID=265551 /ORGANISM="Synedropsis recta cf, Strain CCMP1620" /LENGTH=180 /DNA_ID=CAMNT_0006970283 /DNA_START=159 /DNA_END=701 /DNA_ORIENTATION=+